MNEDHAPMTFKEVTRVAKGLGIKDFKVLDLVDYCRLARQYSEPENCVIFIPEKSNPNMGHYVGCFREHSGCLNYQDSFGSANEFPAQLRNTRRKFKINRTKYQAWNSNNCGYLALLHVCTHDQVDPKVKKF